MPFGAGYKNAATVGIGRAVWFFNGETTKEEEEEGNMKGGILGNDTVEGKGFHGASSPSHNHQQNYTLDDIVRGRERYGRVLLA